jgi:pSer/pThr/pTyr-binding forkhead associated (FHA) protein
VPPDATIPPGSEPRQNPRPESANPSLESQSAPPGYLAIVSGPYSGTILPLSRDVTRVGRDGYVNDHVIDDNAVSDVHLSIRFLNGAFVLTDMDSENGTKINGRPVDRQQLAPNDVILIGQTQLTFIQVYTADETAGPQP